MLMDAVNFLHTFVNQNIVAYCGYRNMLSTIIVSTSQITECAVSCTYSSKVPSLNLGMTDTSIAPPSGSVK